MFICCYGFFALRVRSFELLVHIFFIRIEDKIKFINAKHSTKNMRTTSNEQSRFTFWFVYLSRPWVFPIYLTKWYWIRLTIFRRKSNEGGIWVNLKWWKNFDKKSKTFFKTCNVIFFGGLTTYRHMNFKSKSTVTRCTDIALQHNKYVICK